MINFTSTVIYDWKGMLELEYILNKNLEELLQQVLCDQGFYMHLQIIAYPLIRKLIGKRKDACYRASWRRYQKNVYCVNL